MTGEYKQKYLEYFSLQIKGNCINYIKTTITGGFLKSDFLYLAKSSKPETR